MAHLGTGVPPRKKQGSLPGATGARLQLGHPHKVPDEDRWIAEETLPEEPSNRYPHVLQRLMHHVSVLAFTTPAMCDMASHGG